MYYVCVFEFQERVSLACVFRVEDDTIVDYENDYYQRAVLLSREHTYYRNM